MRGARSDCQDKYCQPEEFTDYLCKQFPKLKDAGGYELLKARGATRSKSLEIIPCPDEGYSAEYLSSSTLGIGAGMIYNQTSSERSKLGGR
ncbi:hypothetical protein QQF64_020039 [Cirrhinus molitorella]|uniref:Uncharacterized protein n=1 Tax=Cirrhinus molitorella TaxID=172907 RepID=A0ABR3LL94_9TELE